MTLAEHAKAAEIVVELGETPAVIYATITDDGQGFEVETAQQKSAEQGSLGMANLRERADLIGGELTVHSTPDQGTRITIGVPKAAGERERKRISTGPLYLRR